MTQKELLNTLNKNSSLDELQEYIKKMVKARGFDKETIEQRVLLLSEEVGELAKAIRKEATNMGIDNNKLNNYGRIDAEVADVLIVLLSICNRMNVNLYEALIAKETKSIERTWTKKEDKVELVTS